MKIRLENVSKSLSFKEHFNARAEVLHLLEGISCELDDGENLAILGQSGSGKSTLAKLISFSEPKSGGKIYINTFLKKRYPLSSTKLQASLTLAFSKC